MAGTQKIEFCRHKIWSLVGYHSLVPMKLEEGVGIEPTQPFEGLNSLANCLDKPTFDYLPKNGSKRRLRSYTPITGTRLTVLRGY